MKKFVEELGVVEAFGLGRDIFLYPPSPQDVDVLLPYLGWRTSFDGGYKSCCALLRS